jgi:hypothetical protein
MLQIYYLLNLQKIVQNEILHMQKHNSQNCDTVLQIDWQVQIWTFPLKSSGA